MISEMAMADIAQMEADGLHPTPRDIVRLNALALVFEGRKKRNVQSLYALPRVAAIDEGRWFREPTVGHEIWLAKVRRWIDENDFETLLAVYAFALSRDSKDLPDGDGRDAVRQAVEAYTEEMKDFTREQVFAAVDYVKNGCDQTVGEEPPPPKSEGESPAGDAEDWTECIALGVLHEGQAILFGVSESEMRKMTRRQLEAVIRRAYDVHGMSRRGGEDEALGDYNRTLDHIRERLERERQETASRSAGASPSPKEVN